MAKKIIRKAHAGDIYVVTNDCYVKYYSPLAKKMVPPVKIGRAKDFIVRIGNMSASVFEDFKYHAVLHVKDVVRCERQIQRRFVDHRIYTKAGGETEFYSCPIEETIKRIKEYVSDNRELVNGAEIIGIMGESFGRSASSQKRKFIEKSKAKENDKKKATKAKGTTFKVKFPDGEIIESPIARDVFVRAIKKFGPRRVAGLGYKSLVGRSEADFLAHNLELKKIGKWYVNAYSSTDSKIQKIKSIAKKLGVSVEVGKVG